MRLRIKPWQIPLRLAAGAFVLNSGLSKRGSDRETAEGLQKFAAGTYPFLNKLDPQVFVKALSTTELVIGATLAIPVVPAGIAGVGLTGFSLGLVGLYLRTPGMRQQSSLRPTEHGLGLAKDVWLLAIGLSLVIDAFTGKRR